MLVMSKERGLELVLYMTGPKLMPLAGVIAYLEKAARKFTCKHVASPSLLHMDDNCSTWVRETNFLLRLLARPPASMKPDILHCVLHGRGSNGGAPGLADYVGAQLSAAVHRGSGAAAHLTACCNWEQSPEKSWAP